MHFTVDNGFSEFWHVLFEHNVLELVDQARVWDQVIEFGEVHRDLPAEASCHQNVFLFVLPDQEKDFLCEISVKVYSIDQLHQDKDLDLTFFPDVKNPKNSFIPNFLNLIHDPIKRFDKSCKINFAVHLLPRHVKIEHFGKHVTPVSKNFLKIISHRFLSTIKLRKLFHFNFVIVRVSTESLENFL